MSRRLLAVLVVSVVLVLSSPLWFRPVTFAVFQRLWPVFFESDIITRFDPQRGMDLLPNLQGARLVAPARPHQVHRVQDRIHKAEVQRRAIFRVNTNALAMRCGTPCQLPSLEPNPKRLRIVCVGDSITFGWGYGYEESYPAFLEQKLQAARPDREVEVINAGIPGLPMASIPGILQQKVAPLKPDVVFALKLGDLMEREPLLAYRQRLEELRRLAQAGGYKLVIGSPPISSFDLHPQGWQFAEALQRFGQETGSPVLVLAPLFKERGLQRGLKLELEGAQQLLVAYEDGQRHVRFSAPAPQTPETIAPELYAWLDRSDETEALFFDDGHPDVEGNQLIAEQLASLLLAQGWF